MSTIWEELRYKVIHSGSKLNLLIGINVAVFLALILLRVIELLTTRQNVYHDLIYSYLVLPSVPKLLLYKPWTVLTYMFIDGSILGFIFNMLWFFWIGQIFEEYLGGKKLLTLYFLGGLAGAVVFVLASGVFPLFRGVVSVADGSSACVMAVIIGTATLLPDYSIFMMFFGEVKLKWIALVYILFDVFKIAGPDAAVEFTHIGAAIMGFVYIRQLRSGHDWGSAIEKVLKPKSKLKVVAKNLSKNDNSKPKQDEIDNILDKISKSGYDSLSKQEKETLFRASNDDRS
jgi:membrane associated rhomboid family serine protease